jgi:hypothetical protein
VKKLSIILFVTTCFCLFLTFFISKKVEEEVKLILLKHNQPDISIELVDYQRHFFTATAISKVQLAIDHKFTVVFNITSSITHYPHQAVIKHKIQIEDEILAQQAENYFATPHWIEAENRVDLFSQLTGMLTISGGKYAADSEFLSTEPLIVNYQMDLNANRGELQLDWAGFNSLSYGNNIAFNSLQFKTQIKQYSDYDYQLAVENVELLQEANQSILNGILLTGRSQKGEVEKTIDTYNELLIDSYLFDDGMKQRFTDNRIKLALTGLFQSESGINSQSINELFSRGAQLTLSQLSSKTPWGTVLGSFDFIFDPGTPLMEATENPYILFDYMNGEADIVLPIALLDEPSVSEPLQLGLMTGFLLQDDQTLHFEMSFLQGEWIVNGRVIPL